MSHTIFSNTQKYDGLVWDFQSKELYNAVIQFVAELAKDPRKVPKSINYNRVYMMLEPKEKLATIVSLEFLNISFLYLRSFCFFSREAVQWYTSSMITCVRFS